MNTLADILLSYQKRFISSPKKRKFWLSARQAGKSFSIAFLSTMKALKKKNGLSLVVSVGARSAAEIIKKCEQMAQAVKILSNGSIDYSASVDQIKFSNGSRVVSLPSGNPGALRGWSAQCICLDEFAFLERPDEVLQAIVPTLTRDPEAELCITSTPGGKQSLFFKMYQDALADDNWYVQTTTIEDAAKDGLKVDIEQLRLMCPDPDIFNQEYMCQFLDAFETFIDTSLLEFGEPPKECEASYAGYDVARTSDKSAIVDLKRLKDGTFFVADAAVMSSVKYSDQIDVFKQLNAKNKWKAGYVDAVGLGGPIAEQIRDTVNARIKPYVWTAANKSPAYEKLRSLIFDRKIRFAEHLKQQLIADFQNISRIVTEAGQIKFSAGHTSTGSHSDIASAIVLAVQAALDNPSSMAVPIAFPSSGIYQHMSRMF